MRSLHDLVEGFAFFYQPQILPGVFLDCGCSTFEIPDFLLSLGIALAQDSIRFLLLTYLGSQLPTVHQATRRKPQLTLQQNKAEH